MLVKTCETSVSVSSVSRMFHVEKCHLSHLVVRQALDEEETSKTLFNFCQWDIHQYENDEMFFIKILLTD